MRPYGLKKFVRQQYEDVTPNNKTARVRFKAEVRKEVNAAVAEMD